MSFVPGFFDSPSMARSKNAAHPWAAPSGSADDAGASLFSNGNVNDSSNSDSNSNSKN